MLVVTTPIQTLLLKRKLSHREDNGLRILLVAVVVLSLLLSCALQAADYREVLFDQPSGVDSSWAFGRDTAGYYYGVAASRNWQAVPDANARAVRWDQNGRIVGMTPSDGGGIANIAALPNGVIAFSRDDDPGKFYCWNVDGSIAPYPSDFFIFASDKETGALAGLDDGKAVSIVNGATTALSYGTFDTIYPTAINASGWVVGTGWDNGGWSHGLIWDPSGVMVMDNVNALFNDINDAGDIAGTFTGGDCFVLRDNMTFWHSLGCGNISTCTCINSAGYVVETGSKSGWGNRNYLDGVGRFNLRLFGFEDFSPYSLEDDFTIVGAQWNWDGHTYFQAAAWTPVPEPSGVIALAGGLIAMLGLKRRRK